MRCLKKNSATGLGDQSAITRVFDLPELRTRIAHHCDSPSMQTLAMVNKPFFDIVQRPSMWLKLYGPATVDLPSCTVFTSWRPNCRGDTSEAYTYIHPAAPKTIKTHKGDPWTLRFQNQNNRIYAPTSVRILDAVSEMTFTSLFSRERLNAEDLLYGHTLDLIRPRVFDFMRDRVYRLEHNILIPIWDEKTRSYITSLCVSTVSLFVFYLCSYQASLATNTSERAAACFGAFAGCVGAVIGYIGLTLSAINGDAQSIGQILSGPLNHQRLNLWSQQIYRLEEAAEAAALFNERQNGADPL